MGLFPNIKLTVKFGILAILLIILGVVLAYSLHDKVIAPEDYYTVVDSKEVRVSSMNRRTDTTTVTCVINGRKMYLDLPNQIYDSQEVLNISREVGVGKKTQRFTCNGLYFVTSKGSAVCEYTNFW